MFDNVAQNNGLVIALIGITVVFVGLVLIAVIISLFNRVFEKISAKEDKETQDSHTGFVLRTPRIKFGGRKIPEDELVALTVALEIFRKLHIEQYPNKITFARGTSFSPWKTGFRYGQRLNVNRGTK
ncbi:OadG family protein [bacterium]|nr:OadG family protein [bacterium]